MQLFVIKDSNGTIGYVTYALGTVNAIILIAINILFNRSVTLKYPNKHIPWSLNSKTRNYIGDILQKILFVLAHTLLKAVPSFGDNSNILILVILLLAQLGIIALNRHSMLTVNPT